MVEILPGQLLGLRAPRARPEQALYPDAPALSVYADGAEDTTEIVAGVCASLQVGAAYQVKLRARAERARRAERLRDVHRATGAPPHHMLFDAARYHGKNRDVEPRQLDLAWAREQLRLGAALAVTDSPYVAEDGAATLHSILTQAAAMRLPVIALLPLHRVWLRARSSALLDAVNRAQVPVALVLEGAGDPLGHRDAVQGLATLCTAEVPVVLLRNDLSAIGGVAYGASMGAIGTRPGLRHLYPIPKKPRRGPPPAHISSYVPSSLAYRRAATISDALLKAGDEQQWLTCDCSHCRGRLLNWIRTVEDAYQHTLEAATGTASRVLLPDSTPGQRRAAWKALCDHAQQVNLELNRRLDGGWEAPAFLGAWRQAPA